MALTFLLGIVLARGLGVGQYGLYALGMSAASLLSVPVAIGLPRVVTREVAIAASQKDWRHFRGLLIWANKTVIFTGLTLAGVVGAGLLTWTYVKGPTEALKVFAVAMVLPPILALGNLRGAALQGMRRVLVGQAPELVIRPGMFLVLLAICFAGVSPNLDAAGALLLHVTAALVAFAIGTYFLLRSLPEEVRQTEPALKADRWLASALPMALTEGMRVGQSHAAILMIGLLSTTTTAGIYKVADAASAISLVPITLLNVVVAPLFASLYAKGDKALLRQLVSWTAVGMVGGVVALSLPFFTLGDIALTTLFGTEYAQSLLPLLILLGGNLISASLGPNSTLLNMTGHERRVTRAFTVALGVNLPLAFLLIPSMGGIGAAIANVAGLVAWNLLLWRDALRYLKLDTSVFGTIMGQLPFNGLLRN